MNDCDYNVDDWGPEAFEHFDFTEKWSRDGSLLDAKYVTHELDDPIKGMLSKDGDVLADIAKGLVSDKDGNTTKEDEQYDETAHDFQDHDAGIDDHLAPIDREGWSDRWWDRDEVLAEYLLNATGGHWHQEPDSPWWDNEYREDEKGRLSWATDPEDDKEHGVDRLRGFIGSALDRTGQAIYYTKAFRSQENKAKRARSKRLDPSARKFSIKSEAAKENDITRYLANKFEKKGIALPKTIEAWDVEIEKHKAKQEERARKSDWIAFLQHTFNIGKSTAYKLRKELEDEPANQEDLGKLIADFDRLRDGDSTPPWRKSKRDPEPPHARVCDCSCGVQTPHDHEVIKPPSMLWAADDEFNQWLKAWTEEPAKAPNPDHISFDDW